MMLQIRRWLAPPVFPDDEIKTRRASLLNAALINIATLIPLILVGNLLGGRTPLLVFGADVLGLASCLVLRAWMRRGQVRLASIALIVTSPVLITASLASLGTIRAPATAMYLLVVITGGLLFGLRGMMITTALCSLLIGGLIGSGNAGLLPRPDLSVTITQWVAYTAILGWTGSLVFSALQATRQALARADNELAERKRAEVAFRESQALLSAVLEGSGASIWAVDRDYRLVFGNGVFIEECRAGLGQATAEGESVLLDFLPPAQKAEWTSLYDRALRGESYSFERERKYSPSPSWTEYHLGPIQNEVGECLGVAIVAHDITGRVRAEQTLCESEGNLRRAEQIAHAGYWSRDVVSGEITWSDETYRIFGFDPQAMKLDLSTLLDHIHPQDRQMVSRAIQDAVAGVRPYDLEYRGLRPNGTVRWVHSKGEVSYDEDGQPIRMFGVVFDITERKRAENALQESEERFRSVVDQMAEGIAVTDLQGCITVWNRSLEQITDLPTREMLGKAIWDVQFQMLPQGERTPKRYEQLCSSLQTFLTTGEAPWAGESLEREYVRPDGSHRFIEEIMFPITVGDRFALASITRDITKRKQAEEAMREAHEHRAAMLDALPDLLFEVDREGRIYDFRTPHPNLLYMPPQGFLGRMVKEVLPKEAATTTMDAIDQAGETGRHSGAIYTLETPAGPGWFELSIAALGDPTAPKGRFIVLARDITERVQAEEAIRAGEARYRGLFDNMISGVAIYEAIDDGQDFTFKDCNRAGEQIDRVKREDLIGRSVLDAFPGVREFGLFEVFQRVWRTGQPERHPTSLYQDKRIVGWRGNYVCRLPSGEIVAIYDDVTERERMEEALRVGLEKYRVLFESFPLGITISDNHGNIVESNRASERLLGLTASEHTHRKINGPEWRIVRPDGKPMPAGEYASVRALHENRLVENVGMGFVKGPGDVTWINVTAAPIPLADYGVAVVYNDISARKLAEDALRESEAKFRNLFNSSEVGMFRTRLDGSEILDMNDKFLTIFGRTRAEMQGFPSVIHWADPREREEMMRQLEAKGRVIDLECGMLNKQGEVRTCLTSLQLYREQGILEGSITDITERKQAEEALQESEGNLRRAQHIAHVGHWSRDVASDEITWSDEAYRIFGFQPKAMKLHLISLLADHIHQEDRQMVVQAVQDAIAGIRPYDLEYRALRPDGTVRWVHSRGEVSLGQDGQPVRMFGAVLDITERKRAEQDIRRRTDEMAALNHSARQLAQSLDLNTIAETITHTCVQAFGARLAWLLSAEPDGSMGHIKHFPTHVAYPAEVTIRWDEGPLGWGPTGRAVRSGNPVVFADLADIPDYVPWREAALEEGFVTSAGIPLLGGGKTWGCLNLYSDQPGFFSPERIEFFETFASQAAVSLENARLFEQVRDARERLQALSTRLLQVQETERRGIARELHDEIGQALTATKIQMLAAQRSLHGPAPTLYLQEGIAIVERTLEQVRSLSLDLRPSLLDDLGLVPALRWYVNRQAEQTGLTAQFVAELPEQRLPAEIEIACFRVVQEALTNVLRHAQAQRISVELRRHEHELRLAIRDDGVGFDVPRVLERAAHGASLGLLGMQERIWLVGGQIEIDSAPAKGTEIRVRVPLIPGHAQNHREGEMP